MKATEPIRERQSAVLGFAEGTGVPVLGVPRTGMINFVLLDPSRPEVARLVAAMVQAREAVMRRSWSHPHQRTAR